MKVLVIGAAGEFAGLVVPALKQKGITVYALVQDADKGSNAMKRGADYTVTGDLNDPKSLSDATKGMDGVFHINPAFAPHEADLGVAMVTAAKENGVKKFVFSSVYHPGLSLINHNAKLPVEEALYNSGMDFTILQPAMYMQMLNSTWKTALESGLITMPYSMYSKMCYVDYRDVAEAVAIAMTTDRLSYGTFELCSNGMYNRLDLATLMGYAMGRTINAEETSPDEFAKHSNMPDGGMKEGLVKMMQHYDRAGFAGGNDLVLKTILGRAPRSVVNYFEELKQNS